MTLSAKPVPKYGQSAMRISLDTNIWIFGIVGNDSHCERILFGLHRFDVIMPDQVRRELERNLSDADMKQFYRFLLGFGVRIDYSPVPQPIIDAFEEKGLKKGDAEIAAFCELNRVDVIISGNRDFLRGLAPGYSFDVQSPAEFCTAFGL